MAQPDSRFRRSDEPASRLRVGPRGEGGEDQIPDQRPAQPDRRHRLSRGLPRRATSRIDEGGRMGAARGPCRLDRPARALRRGASESSSGNSASTTSRSRMPAQAHQRPKLQRYGDSLFVVARTAEMIGDRIEFGETHLFVGRGYRRLGPPRPVGLLHEGPRPLRSLAGFARPGRDLHPLFDPRFHRRQLSGACSSACRRKPRRSRTTCSPSG